MIPPINSKYHHLGQWLSHVYLVYLQQNGHLKYFRYHHKWNQEVPNLALITISLLWPSGEYFTARPPTASYQLAKLIIQQKNRRRFTI